MGYYALAENFWEVLQYYGQNDPHYDPVEAGFPNFELADTINHPERDPYYSTTHNKKLWCTPVNTIIFTDGAPYKDATLPDEVIDFDSDSNADDSNATTHGKDNLDDVTCWGYSEDKVSPASSSHCSNIDTGTRDLRDDLAGDQSVRVYTVAFTGDAVAQVLEDAADNADGKSYPARDGKALQAALTEAFTDAIANSSASSVSLDTGHVSDNTTLYQATFDGNGWDGELTAYGISYTSDDAAGLEKGDIIYPHRWKASEQLPATRHIFTQCGDAGCAFNWDNGVNLDLTSAQKTALDDDETVLDYLRGVQTNEEDGAGSQLFRKRTSLLGDIVHSNPIFIGAPSLPYPNNLDGSGASAYSAFKNDYASRTKAVYVGANDGMLHAFRAEDSAVDAGDAGTELFAYIPSMLFSKLALLTDPEYGHQYYVDGTPTILDAYFASEWHSVLVGGLGAGGQGIYALDVTDPSAFATGKVMWEFSDAEDKDLGLTFGTPSIARMQNGKWVAIFGNGYNNTVADGNASITGYAALYIVDIENGDVIAKISTDTGTVGTPNGLNSPTPIDINGDYIVDYIYAGDLEGNMWKFDVTSIEPTSWTAKKLFTACTSGTCSGTNRQPITSRPTVGRHPTGVGYMVFFGTGKYIEVNDKQVVSQPTQSFYGVWDKNEVVITAFDRDHLLQQKIYKEVSVDTLNDNETTNQGEINTGDDNDYRLVTSNGINWHSAASPAVPGDSTTHMGWYIDLYNTQSNNTNNGGERQVSTPILREGKIIFTTLIPSQEPVRQAEAGG